ncbi:MAG: S8 family serine peptidase [Acidobacteria bacterium]|nr:S8 family serine peptidase [Acidobacteriota bacterium]
MSLRIAVVDSGIHAPNPYAGAVAGGVSLVGGDWDDVLGHGTVVAATIREKAPHALLYAVKVFDHELVTGARLLAEAIEWCVEQEMDLVNLSLGARNSGHAAMLAEAARKAVASEIVLVAAAGYLPGDLDGAVAVIDAADCPRDQMRRIKEKLYAASPHPRPMPGMPSARGLAGVSFAVANVTGLLAASIRHRANPERTPGP